MSAARSGARGIIMTNRERALAAFRLEETDSVPVCVFLGGSWQIAESGSTYKELLGEPEHAARIFVDSSEEFDADIATVGTGATALFMKALGGRVEFNRRGFPVILEEPLKSKEDLGRLTPEMIVNDPDVRSLIASSASMSRLFGGKRLLLGNARGPFTLAGQMFGLENLSRALYKDTGFANELIDFTTQTVLLYFRAMIGEGGADGIVIADPTASGDVISRRHFDKFALPCLEKIAGEMRSLEKPVMLHICGNIADRLEQIADLPIDCLSVDTKMDLGLVEKRIGGRLCIAGNVNPVDVLKFGSPQKTAAEAERCIKLGGGRGFVLMPGCDIAPGVPRENIQALLSAARVRQAAEPGTVTVRS